MTRRLRLVLILASIALPLLLAACVFFPCWVSNLSANDYNPNFLNPVGEIARVAPQAVYVATSPDGHYVAVSSYGNDPNGGILSLIDVGGTGPGRVSQVTVGDRPYGLLWLSNVSLLVCNEGLAATGGNATLQLVTLTRGSDDPNDEAYDIRHFGDPNDIDAFSDIAPFTIVGPSEAVIIPGTNAIALVTLRFSAGLFQVGLTSATPDQSQLLPTLTNDPLDEPRGIDVTPDGSQAWICNYGKGANNRTALALAQNLAAAKLNRFRGVVPDDPSALDQALADADAWLADNQDPDGELPYRWPEPGEGPDDQALHDAEALSDELADYNVRADCTNPDDANCPLSPDQWADVDTSAWPTDPNLGAADPNLVLGDANNADHHYTYDEVAGLFERQVEEDGQITVYSLIQGLTFGSISVPPRPTSIRFTPDGTLAVVTCGGHDGVHGSVVVLSTSTQLPIVRRDFDFVPAQVRINAAGSRAYISAWTGNQMAVINLAGLCSDGTENLGDTLVRNVAFRPRAIDTTPDIDLLWAAWDGADPNFSQAAALDIFQGLIRVPRD